MRGQFKNLVLIFGVAVLFPVIAPAGAKFQKIQRPNTVDTLPSGINDDGCIVGTDETAAQVGTSTEEGFRLCGDNWTTISYADLVPHSDLGGINNDGKIVGTHDNTSGNHCFLRAKNGTYTSFDVPYGNTSPDCNGINDGGYTVGVYTDTSNHGWLRTPGGTFYSLNATFGGATNTEANGINKAGDIVGSYKDASSNTRGFLKHNGEYKRIDYPGLTTPDTDAYAINDQRDIGGSYTDSSFTDHGFLRRDDDYTTVDVPFTDASETNKVTGINNRGCMVGVYTSSNAGFPEYGFKAGLRDADGDGEVRSKNYGTARTRFHEDDCIEQPDSVEHSDPSSNTNFRSTQVTTVTYNKVLHSVTLGGFGTNNGVPVGFVITAVDSTLVPPGVFSIVLSDGYSNSGFLLTGAIRLH